MLLFVTQVSKAHYGKRFPGNWRSLAIIEAPRNARKNSRTSSSTTGEPKKAEPPRPTAKLIGFSISWKLWKLNPHLPPSPTLNLQLRRCLPPQCRWLTFQPLSLKSLFHQHYPTLQIPQQTLQFPPSLPRRHPRAGILHTTMFPPPIQPWPQISSPIPPLPQPPPTKNWRDGVRERGSGKTSSRG